MITAELLEFIKMKKGYQIEGIENVDCPGLLLSILVSMRQIAIAGPYSETVYKGRCGGRIGDEYGCGVSFEITGELERKILKVVPSTSNCVSS